MVWEFDDYLAEVASPVATDEFLIVATSFGAVACFDSKTGEELWVHDFDEGFYASPVIAGDLVYLMDMNGLTHIVKAAREFQLVAQSRFLLGERLDPRSLLQQLELGLADVLPQQERSLLQGIHDTVGIGLDQRRQSIEEFHGHLSSPSRYLRSPTRPALYPRDCSCLSRAGAMTRFPVG